jgi:hypothetical protein
MFFCWGIISFTTHPEHEIMGPTRNLLLVNLEDPGKADASNWPGTAH